MTTKPLAVDDLKALRGALRSGRFTQEQRAAIVEAIEQDDTDGVLAVINGSAAALKRPTGSQSSDESFLGLGAAYTNRGWNKFAEYLQGGHTQETAELRGPGDAHNSRHWAALVESGFFGENPI